MSTNTNTAAISYKLRIASEYEASGKTLHAIQIYRSILEAYPDAIECYYRLADIYEQIGKREQTSALLDAALCQFPKNNALRLFAGHFAFKNQRWSKTIEILSPISSEQEPMVAFFTGYSHFMLEDYQAAKAHFQNYIAIDTNPTFVPDAHVYLAKTFIHLHRYEDALASVKLAEKLLGPNSDIHLLFAIVYYYLGMDTHAVHAIENALLLADNDIRIYEWAGNVYLKVKEYEKLEKLYYRFISGNEASAMIYYNLGLACLHSDKLKEAETYLTMAAALEPENVMISKTLKQLSSKYEIRIGENG